MQSSAYPVFRVSIVAVLLFQVTALFARSMLDIRLRRHGLDPDVANDLSYLVVPPILLVLMFPYLRRCRDSLRQLFSPKRLTLRVVGCSIALGLTLRLMWWAATTFLIGIGVFRNGDPNAVVGPIIGFDCPQLYVLALSLLAMGLVAPVTEEIMHRGFFLHGALPHGQHVAVVVSAVTFALVHVVRSYAAAFFAGLVFAVQALNYRALWGPIITHATYNVAAIVDWDCLRLVWNPTLGDPTLLKLTWASVPTMIAGTWVVVLLIGRDAAGTVDVLSRSAQSRN